MRRLFVVALVALFCSASGLVDAAATKSPQGPPAGATDPDVSDANAATTICASKSTTAGPSKKARAKLFARYKIATSRRGRYIVDLVVPSSLGGTLSPRNLWPQRRTDAGSKDAVEELLHSFVCTGQVDLATAQQAIANDWTAASAQVQIVADARKAAVGAYIAAQPEAERQAAVAAYIASLPPPTTAPPVETAPPTASRPRHTCEELVLAAPPYCLTPGETRCAAEGTPYVCTFLREIDGRQIYTFQRA